MDLLTPKQLYELTECARKGDQIEWLRRRRWVFEIGETGRPKVDIAEYERHMIGGKKQPQKKGPNTSWYGSQTSS